MQNGSRPGLTCSRGQRRTPGGRGRHTGFQEQDRHPEGPPKRNSLDCARKPRGQLHDSREGIASRDRCCHVGDEDTFQNIQDFILRDLSRQRHVRTAAGQGLHGQLSSGAIPSSLPGWAPLLLLPLHKYLDRLLLFTLPRHQQLPVLSYAPGSHLHQRLLAEARQQSWVTTSNKQLTVLPKVLPPQHNTGSIAQSTYL